MAYRFSQTKKTKKELKILKAMKDHLNELPYAKKNVQATILQYKLDKYVAVALT